VLVDAQMLQAVQTLAREVGRLADEEGHTREQVLRLLGERTERIADLQDMAATLLDHVMG
jgi:hypothetical protein